MDNQSHLFSRGKHLEFKTPRQDVVPVTQYLPLMLLFFQVPTV